MSSVTIKKSSYKYGSTSFDLSILLEVSYFL